MSYLKCSKKLPGRMTGFVTALFVVCAFPGESRSDQARDSFSAFLASQWLQAREHGISRKTFDNALAGVRPDQRIVAATKRQPEFAKPVGDYIARAVSKARISSGRRFEKKWRSQLSKLEDAYGVDPLIIVSILGLETSYGAIRPKWDVFRSLATLAHERYRDDFFAKQLIAALKILESGEVNRQEMLGSWAGAMGQPQFIPTSYLDYAVDFSGDGKRDIWKSTPDVLGSIANYLKHPKWIADLPWGMEVAVPAGFDYRRSRASFAKWADLGFKRVDKKRFPRDGDAVLLFPSGAEGPAFLVTDNFLAIKRYNNSDAYALAVGHLADRIRGGSPITTPWPKDERPMSRKDRIALQKQLAKLGYTVSNRVGRIDFEMRDTIRQVQFKLGQRPDGYPTSDFLSLVTGKCEVAASQPSLCRDQSFTK